MSNKLAANVPNSVGRNPLFYSFVSFLIVSLIPFTSNPDSSTDLTIFLITLISSFEIINAVVLERKVFLITASGVPIPGDDFNGSKIFLGYGMSTHFSLIVNQLSLMV